MTKRTTAQNRSGRDGCHLDPLTLVACELLLRLRRAGGQRKRTGRLTPRRASTTGSYIDHLSASDGDATDSQSHAHGPNRLAHGFAANPIASLLEAASAQDASSIFGSGADPDGDALSYKWFDGAAQIARPDGASHAWHRKCIDLPDGHRQQGRPTNSAAQSVVAGQDRPSSATFRGHHGPGHPDMVRLSLTLMPTASDPWTARSRSARQGLGPRSSGGERPP